MAKSKAFYRVESSDNDQYTKILSKYGIFNHIQTYPYNHYVIRPVGFDILTVMCEDIDNDIDIAIKIRYKK